MNTPSISLEKILQLNIWGVSAGVWLEGAGNVLFVSALSNGFPEHYGLQHDACTPSLYMGALFIAPQPRIKNTSSMVYVLVVVTTHTRKGIEHMSEIGEIGG
jgi:hypothetical protein